MNVFCHSCKCSMYHLLLRRYLNIYVKLLAPEFAIINFLTEVRYYFTNGFTVLVLTAFFLYHRRHRAGTETAVERNLEKGRQRDTESSEEWAVSIALAASVLLFAASRIWVDLLPVELQPFLVRAAITISAVMVGLLAAHHRRTTGAGGGETACQQTEELQSSGAEDSGDDGEGPGETAALRSSSSLAAAYRLVSRSIENDSIVADSLTPC